MWSLRDEVEKKREGEGEWELVELYKGIQRYG